ncbi:SDR family oxidoreductase [Rhodococcus sp. WAY2]|uniref:SDR family oxidoreductase n=1 Tax=Rhodococcus sp. WAY2 TaxID=2663121 RepID=UPI0013205032|nr:SDR family oxidoreductase [Rhodococcus sp. WAY2]QHE73311.1 Oxidoreductase, short-chain dehydrogenase/reductase family [Rhodococcus sp. WAY2]
MNELDTSFKALVDEPGDGKLALIAGGSSGINLSIAQGLARQGSRVVLLSRSADRLEAAARSISEEGGWVEWFSADVRDAEAVAASVELCARRHGPIDVVLSGAAGNFLAPAADLSSNGFRTVVDIDLTGTFNVFRHSYPHLRRPGAVLIAISAPQAVRPMRNQVHASAAKAGVNMLVKNLALEWGPEGVRVNAISPGFIAETEGTARLIDTPQKKQALLESIPLGRLGRMTEIAELTEFLVSDRAAYITGSVIECDGGLLVA